MLKYEVHKVISVQDWNSFIRKVYGKPYHFQQQNGCRDRGSYFFEVPECGEDYPNDSIKEEINGSEMGVSLKAWLARDPKAPVGKHTEQWKIDLFWYRNFYPEIHTLVEDLYSKGLIEKGEYIINIDW